MKYYKLGDSLEYLIYDELKERKLNCYCSVVVYMYLNDLIDAKTAKYLQRQYIKTLCNGQVNMATFYRDIKGKIARDPYFKKCISNDIKGEYIKSLNKYIIDEWIIVQAKSLILLLPRVRLEDKYLYFYEGKHNEEMLYRIYIPDIDKQHSIYRFAKPVIDGNEELCMEKFG